MPGLGREIHFCVCINASAAIVQCVFMFIYLPLSLPLSVDPQQSLSEVLMVTDNTQL